ncbi:hypothetical protein KIPB_002083 [Kipferlia bialata]|uniref:SET domain-containing protein n=1 Tax=Kipferlia bialata TaxID=797122 RepID=A0A9K3CPM5_9EUKA|nr:hypothetical protein KIPB_002083 [Kipferlia bialata]|eukprot:g2083.t1
MVENDGIRVCPIPGYGLGVIAERAFKRGDCVLRERPLIHFGKPQSSAADAPRQAFDMAELTAIIKGLSDEDRSQLTALHDRDQKPGQAKTYIGIINTNSFGCTCGSINDGACVCIIASRINHSCFPNLTRYWSHSEEVMCFMATYPIQPGDQLFVSYCDSNATQAVRQKTLTRYGFQCQCRLCSLTGHALLAHDAAAVTFEVGP